MKFSFESKFLAGGRIFELGLFLVLAYAILSSGVYWLLIPFLLALYLFYFRYLNSVVINDDIISIDSPLSFNKKKSFSVNSIEKMTLNKIGGFNVVTITFYLRLQDQRLLKVKIGKPEEKKWQELIKFCINNGISFVDRNKT